MLLVPNIVFRLYFCFLLTPVFFFFALFVASSALASANFICSLATVAIRLALRHFPEPFEHC